MLAYTFSLCCLKPDYADIGLNMPIMRNARAHCFKFLAQSRKLLFMEEFYFPIQIQDDDFLIRNYRGAGLRRLLRVVHTG